MVIISGKGNKTVCSEFNFFSDPEAAKIVLTQLEGPITVIGMDPCYENAITWVMQSLDSTPGR